MINRYRLENCKNELQGRAKRVLCVCSTGLLRSPTAALVLSSEPFNFNTRAAGIDPDEALILVDEVLIRWADEFVCMEARHGRHIEFQLKNGKDKDKPVIVLNIDDNFRYRDPELMKLIADKYRGWSLVDPNAK